MVDGRSEHKKAKDGNENTVATISHSEYRDVLLNKKHLKLPINRTQSRDHHRQRNFLNQQHFRSSQSKFFLFFLLVYI